MPRMEYTLMLLSHGEAPALHRVLESFAAMVTPRPKKLIAVIDGPGALPGIDPLGPWRIHQTGISEGFCVATGRLWRLAAQVETDYVFHLENDFLFSWPVDLRQLAYELEFDPRLAQMALMRNPVNPNELAAGGLYESRPGQYEMRQQHLEHVSYFTTNPSLMTRRFMAENPWMGYMDECEGHYGLDLVKRGYKFGVWGSGRPWVQHIGERTGFGY